MSRAKLMLTIGELIDRASIVRLKMANLPHRSDEFRGEYDEILSAISHAYVDYCSGDNCKTIESVVRATMDLTITNGKIWDLEDVLRDVEDVSTIAKEIAKLNDLRSRHKRDIDDVFGTGTATSEKSYPKEDRTWKTN